MRIAIISRIITGEMVPEFFAKVKEAQSSSLA